MRLERKKRIRQLALWTWSWVATVATATFGTTFLGDHPIFNTIAIVVNLVIGVLMILANRNLFREFDELEKKIHLESMAITLGLSVIFGLSCSLLYQTNLIGFKPEIHHLVMFIGITYLVSMAINTRKYA